MMSRWCDLHLHSTASDGTDGPELLGRLAAQACLAAIALTDHDTVEGLADCAAGCAAQGIAFLPGVEFSCQPMQETGTLHLLGYGIEAGHPGLLELTDRQQQARRQRIDRIIERLGQLGVDITGQEVADAADGAAVGRPHVAQVLLAKGYVKSISDAFTRYIGQGAPGYVPKPKVAVEQAIAAVHAAGGLAVLAHPVQMRYADRLALAGAIGRLKEMGLDGLEVHHPDHSPSETTFLMELAGRFELLVTGGSDYHGRRRDAVLGQPRVPLEVYDRLRRRLDQ